MVIISYTIILVFIPLAHNTIRRVCRRFAVAHAWQPPSSAATPPRSQCWEPGEPSAHAPEARPWAAALYLYIRCSSCSSPTLARLKTGHEIPLSNQESRSKPNPPSVCAPCWTLNCWALVGGGFSVTAPSGTLTQSSGCFLLSAFLHFYYFLTVAHYTSLVTLYAFLLLAQFGLRPFCRPPL